MNGTLTDIVLLQNEKKTMYMQFNIYVTYGNYVLFSIWRNEEFLETCTFHADQKLFKATIN